MDEMKHTALTAMLESIAEQDAMIHTLDWRVIQAALRKAGDEIQRQESKLQGCEKELSDARQSLYEIAEQRNTLSHRLDSGALFAHLTHGDEQHQKWLREALEAYVRGEPRIPPYGQGITEALREKVERTEQWLLAEIRERGSLHLDEHGEGYLSACLNAWQKITGRQEWPT